MKARLVSIAGRGLKGRMNCQGCGIKKKWPETLYDGKFCNKSCKKQRMNSLLREYWELRRELGRR